MERPQSTAIPVRGQLEIGQKIPVAEVGAFTRAGVHPTCEANMCFHRVYVPVLHAASSPHTLLLICGLPDVIKQSDFPQLPISGISRAILLV